MTYYEILIGDIQFHGKGALTYSSIAPLRRGNIVIVLLRQRKVFGIVTKEVKKPSFSVKEVSGVFSTTPLPEQTFELIDWLSSYYPAPLGAVVRLFVPSTVAKAKNAIQIDETATSTDDASPTLTSDQQKVFDQIKEGMSYILHGVTGSGKTRLYQALAARTTKENKSVILLTPEIGLTSQLLAAFRKIDTPLYLIHSRQTIAARREVFRSILEETRPCIVLGPRSALFTPLHNLGLIVIDEAHDSAYKNDQSPHYRTERVAAVLTKLHNATLISGTATPNIEEVYIAQAKKATLLSLQNRAKRTDMPAKTTLVDMRNRSNLQQSRIISAPLVQAIHNAISAGEQSLLFLNRRGTASTILCTNCGWRAVCAHCDLPLTYHGDTHKLRCHVCGRTTSPPLACPECASSDIIFRSIGTKAVVEEVKKLFPSANIKRFDTDTNLAEQLDKQLAGLQKGDGDIIVGTQMIAKGLDLPLLSVVGVLNADTGLQQPDFSAPERTFQLISQVVGRVGRGHRAGHVYIQTYDPENPVLVYAASQDWQSFYNIELAERKMYRFPPFCHLLKLSCVRASSSGAERAAQKLAAKIEHDYAVQIEGPAPSFHPKEGEKYRWQLVVKSSSRQRLLDIIADLPSGWSHDIDPVNLL